MFTFSLQFNDSEFRREVTHGAQPVILAFLAEVRNQMRRLFDLPKSGRRGPYRRRSAPGEAPARQTGRLAEDMDIRPVPLAPQLLINAPYADVLEYGKGKIAPRPYVQPALEDARRRFDSIQIF